MAKELIVTIIVALIGMVGASVGSIFGYRQFLLKRKDEKEERNVQKLIEEAVEKAKQEMQEEFYQGLQDRENTGRERFEINSEAIKENSVQIGKLVGLVENQITKMDAFAESMTSLNKVVKATAEAQRNTNYDRFLTVASKVLRDGNISITDKTNLKQLYTSWKDLDGSDPKIDTMYEECMKLTLNVNE
jgi:hypothetical protein